MIDFYDTPMGTDLLERIHYIEDQIEDLQDELSRVQAEFDMQEEMWEDSLEDGEDL